MTRREVEELRRFSRRTLAGSVSEFDAATADASETIKVVARSVLVKNDLPEVWTSDDVLDATMVSLPAWIEDNGTPLPSNTALVGGNNITVVTLAGEAYTDQICVFVQGAELLGTWLTHMTVLGAASATDGAPWVDLQMTADDRSDVDAVFERNATTGVLMVCGEGLYVFAVVRYEPCASSPCVNGATCQGDDEDGEGFFYGCECAVGWTGDACDTAMDKCVSSPCQNNGTCVDGSSAFACICTVGWTGSECTEDINECASSPCANGSTCAEGSSVGTFECSCSAGYSAAKCDVFLGTVCDSSPCTNGGTCVAVNGTSWECECTSSHHGDTCDQQLDPCVSAQCGGGTCVQTTPYEYVCACGAALTGAQCDIAIDGCSSSPCANGGACLVDVASGVWIFCNCTDGFVGVQCTENVDECGSSPCLNEGVCRDGVASVTCECAVSFTGVHCETPVDACASSPCHTGAVCTTVVGSVFECSCATSTDVLVNNRVCASAVSVPVNATERTGEVILRVDSSVTVRIPTGARELNNASIVVSAALVGKTAVSDATATTALALGYLVLLPHGTVLSESVCIEMAFNASALETGFTLVFLRASSESSDDWQPVAPTRVNMTSGIATLCVSSFSVYTVSSSGGLTGGGSTTLSTWQVVGVAVGAVAAVALLSLLLLVVVRRRLAAANSLRVDRTASSSSGGRSASGDSQMQLRQRENEEEVHEAQVPMVDGWASSLELDRR